MALWLYEARDAAGQVVRGSHQAPSREEALHFLRAQGLFLTRLDARKEGAALVAPSHPVATPKDSHKYQPPQNTAPRGKTSAKSGPTPLLEEPFSRASKRDLSLFFRQIASALHAGVSLGAALSTLQKHGEVRPLQNVAAQLGPRVQNGEPISVGMKAFPGLFTPLMVGITRAGEKSGALEGSFSRLADYAERDYSLETTIKRETLYPKILLAAAIFIPAVVPLVLQGPVAALRQVMLPVSLVGGGYALWRFSQFYGPLALRRSGMETQLDALKLKLPVIGKVSRGLASAKFCRALGALYGAGVSPVESLQLSALSCGNQVLSRRAVAQTPLLLEGMPLSQLLQNTEVFHPMALQMLKVGEDTGDIDGQLEKAADFLEADAETAIRQAIPILSALVFLAVAAYIGYLVVSYYTGHATRLEGLIE